MNETQKTIFFFLAGTVVCTGYGAMYIAIISFLASFTQMSALHHYMPTLFQASLLGSVCHSIIWIIQFYRYRKIAKNENFEITKYDFLDVKLGRLEVISALIFFALALNIRLYFYEELSPYINEPSVRGLTHLGSFFIFIFASPIYGTALVMNLEKFGRGYDLVINRAKINDYFNKKKIQ